MKNAYIGIVAGLALVATGANAAVVGVAVNNDPAQNKHTFYSIGGSNGAAPSLVYGDGALTGASPNNICIDGPSLCANGNPAATPPVAPGTYVAGSNGPYWGANSTPAAQYTGLIQYDNAITFVDAPSGDTYFRVTGGILQWTGTYGIEIAVTPTSSVGGSFFGYTFNNASIDLTTGTRAAGSTCYLGAAGAMIVGSLLCGVANPLSSYGYANSGTTYTKSADWAGVRFNPDGTMHLLLTSSRYTASGSGNNIREEMNLIPVPAAAWLFGSAFGLLGWMRRKTAI